MTTPTPPYRRLTRSQDNKMIAGVCGGAAEYLGMDPTLIRVLTLIAGVFTFPVTPLIYLLCWAIIPRD